MIKVIAFLLVCSASCFASDTTDLTIKSWISAGLYGSHYSTSRGDDEFHDLLNSAPGDDIGLNNIYIGVRATSSNVFGALTLQHGDMPRSGWDPDLPWLQEAWLGYHVTKDFDVTAGAFTSVLGVESLMCYENYSGIISVPGFFNPGFYSGIQVLWKTSSTTSVNAGVVSAFSDFAITGSLPALSLGFTYSPEHTSAFAIQSILSEESVDRGDRFQLYTSMTAKQQMNMVHVLSELNVCLEFPKASYSASYMVSGLVGVYYDVLSTLQAGLRLEAMYDPQGALAESRFNKPLPYETLSMAGVTTTLTYRPSRWSVIRADARYLGVLDTKSFIEIDPNARERRELVLSTDIFFVDLFQQ